MTTMELVQTMKVRRDRQRHEHNIAVRREIKEIQKEMVELSFSKQPDLKQHKLLMSKLKVAKLKLR